MDVAVFVFLQPNSFVELSKCPSPHETSLQGWAKLPLNQFSSSLPFALISSLIQTYFQPFLWNGMGCRELSEPPWPQMHHSFSPSHRLLLLILWLRPTFCCRYGLCFFELWLSSCASSPKRLSIKAATFHFQTMRIIPISLTHQFLLTLFGGPNCYHLVLLLEMKQPHSPIYNLQ